MDWLQEFKDRFSHHDLLNKLKEEKFYGKVTLNFCNGIPNTVHIEMCVKGDEGSDVR